MTSLTESELLQGSTAHSSRHEGNDVSERSRGGYPSGQDAILRYPGNEFVGPSDNHARIDESELEEGTEVGSPVSARTRAKGSKPDSRLVSGERSQQSARRSQMQHFTVVDASNAEDATLLTLHSNYGPVAYRFSDKRRFQSKNHKIFPPLCI